MIGIVTWPGRGGRPPMTATLEDDGTFSITGLAPEIGEVTARHYADQCRWASDEPGAGPYGVAYLRELARRVGGSVAFEPKEEPPADRVY